VILAAAGLLRLDRADAVSELLSIDQMLPAPGQGVIALQIRDDDEAARAALRPIHDAATFTALRAERALLAELGAGCALPIGGLAHVRAGEVVLVARVFDMRGIRVIGVQESGPQDDSEAVGRRAAASLIARGARDLLQEAVS
jgi:hydroxymethylbilane synthase